MIHSEQSLTTHPQVKELGHCILDPDTETGTERFRHADCHWVLDSGMSLHTTDRVHGLGLQTFGFCDSGLTMLPASAILRLWNVDSGLFTPLAALCPRPAAGGLRSLGFMESGRLHCSGGHLLWNLFLESWNLGMCSKFGLKSRSGILESWNLGICD